MKKWQIHLIRTINILAFSLIQLSHVYTQNLVINPSFESYLSCPTSTSQIHLTGNWIIPSNTGAASPDYYNSCATNTYVSVPKNVCGYQQARTGSAYSGIYTYGYNCREYLMTELASPLIQGVRYKVEFYVNPVNDAGIGVDAIGAFFSQNAVTGDGTYNALQVSPQINNQSGIITDTVAWTLISGTFRADGGEKFITIGNFKSDSQTQTQTYNSTGWNRGYYHVEDVSVIAVGDPLSIVGDSIICTGESTELEVNGAGPFTWATEQNPSMVISNDSVITVTPATTTTYLAYNLEDTVKVKVQVVPYPQVDLGKDTVLCEGEKLELNAEFPGSDYLWQDNSTAAIYTVNESGIYWVQVSLYSCSSSDTIEVGYNKNPTVDLGSDTALCPEDTLWLSGGGVESETKITWNNKTTSGNYMVTEAGTYWVEVTENNCTSSDTITVSYDPLPEVDLGNDTLVCKGDYITLDAYNQYAGSYSWSDGSTSAFTTVKEGGEYWVVLSNRCGSVADSVLIDTEDFSCNVYIPSAFSPNGDGINDEFKLHFHSQFEKFSMLIYDRWGTLLFVSEDGNTGWNGKHKGELVPSGVYVWFVKYGRRSYGRIENGEHHGSVTVIH